MTKELTAKSFQTEVKDHEITVKHDDGIYRHLRLGRPDSVYNSFHIVTWPGCLSYSGDMGDFTFMRLHDMFEFFRAKEPNLGYWAEKLEATDRRGGHEEFSQEKLKEHIKHDFDEYWEFDNSEHRHGDWEDIESEFLEREFYSEDDARFAIYDYKSPFSNNEFVDSWEWNLRDYTWRFQFACHAIPWAIGKYDEYKLTKAHGEHA